MKTYRQFILEGDDRYLRTAIKYDGKLWKGHQGEYHEDLINRKGILFGPDDMYESKAKYGYVDHMGRFKDREKEDTYSYARENGLLKPDIQTTTKKFNPNALPAYWLTKREFK